ncbi:ankyrin repeat-containing domain protein [Elaphomyces granulatus]
MSGDKEQMSDTENVDPTYARNPHPAPPSPPRDRRDFEIAIICALPLEASAVRAFFDERYDDRTYGKAPKDSNAYSTGMIGHHNVVLVHMPNIGKVAAATAAACLRASFQGIQLALVVGICGAAPFGKQGEGILLGDVVISEGLVQYDLGKQFPGNRFVRKDTPRDNLPRPGPEIRAALAKLQTEQWLQDKTSEYLGILQQKLSDVATYPGSTEDRLFKSTYRHQHHDPLECPTCTNGRDDVCDKAIEMSCQQLKCHERELVPRALPIQPSNPAIHFGLVASGDTVMRSGEDRDDIATRDGVIAFEMEGAGVWENFPSLVIKGVCDYADSHKNKRWQVYAAATAAAVTKGFLENWSTAPLSLGVRTGELEKGPARRAKELEILKRLHKSPYRDRKERIPDRIPGTCEWFVAHELFRDWQESKSSRMLWVSADPGCGKSVLAKYLVDSVLATTESRTTCYFFFNDDFEDQRSIVCALCCILHQLFLQKRVLLSDKIFEQFEMDGERFTHSFNEVWDAIISAAEDKNAGKIICLFDAIDECEDRGRSQLTQALCKLYGTMRNSNLKFLVTSRPYGGIRRGFQPLKIPGLPVIHLSGESEVEMEKISREIDVFINARVENIGAKLNLKNDEQELLLQKLMRVPNRTYLWVSLTLDLIEGDIDIDKTRIANATSHLPKTVDEAYERILSRSRNFEEAKRLLHIIVAAERPLTLKEMSVALAIRDNHRSYGDLDLRSEERFRENVRDLCGLFVTIMDLKIYLLHQTAKEFLVQNSLANGPKSVQSNFKWKYSLRPQESHRILAEICIWYLLFGEFETHPLHVNTSISHYVDSHVLLDYSAKHWTVHFHRSHIKPNRVIQSLMRICDASSNSCMTWFSIYWKNMHADFPKNFTPLMIASYFGLRAVVERLLESDGISLNSEDGTYQRSALSWAAGNGFDVIVKLLIKGTWVSWVKSPFRPGVAVDSADRYGRTALSYAVWKGHIPTVKLLLKAGARVDSTDEIGGTPLSYAICNGQKAVVELLLKKGTQVDSPDNIGKELLLSAAEKGHEAVVKLLLENEKGANIEPKDSFGRTPLFRAAVNEHEEVVKLLLEKGANLESKDGSGQTSLLWAARNRHQAAVMLLLEKGADIESKDGFDRTPLLWAAANEDEEVVKLLLEKGADLESEDGPHTPLLWAAEKGHEAMVKLLLEKGADLESKDDSDRTPLLWAARNGHEEVVKLLLENGADLDSSTCSQTPLLLAIANEHEKVVKLLLEKGAELESFNRIPLLWAARKGHEAVVKLLLEKGADLEPKDGLGRTPLSWAAERGHEAVVKLLLGRGANIESKDGSNQTPLLWAARNGHQAVVMLLLEKGADLESSDSTYSRTPLLWAVVKDHVEVVMLLLEKGAGLGSKDGSDNTLLLWAAEKGHEAMVKLLLEKGVDFESKDGSDRTPLLLAARKGHEPVVKLLLEKGADIESKDGSDQTPLLWATGKRHEAVVKLLLEKGADFECKDVLGRTPLSWAAENGHDAVVKLLLEKGADLDSKDSSDNIPLLWAAEKGQEAMVKLLLEKGARNFQ